LIAEGLRIERVEARPLALRDGREPAQRQARRQTAGHLGGAEDRAVAGVVDEVARYLTVRRGADAARVEVRRPAPLKQLASLDEERAALVEEGLEGREVHLRRIGLHLPEVRVDGGVERDVRAEAHLHVETRAGVRGAAGV